MARPATPVSNWASNANYVSGLGTGSPTKAAPGAGQIADGWRPNQKPPPNWQNWWQNLVDSWLLYVDEPARVAGTPYPLASQTNSKFCRSFHSLQNFTVGNIPGAAFVQGAGPTVNDHMCFELNPPHGTRLTTVSVCLQGAAGHGALPANPPVFTLFDISDGNVVNWVNQGDVSANVAAYEVSHHIIFAGVPLPVLRTHRYMVYLQGEGGANSIAGLTVTGVGYVFDQLTAMDLTGA